jgi:hypothetical protein
MNLEVIDFLYDIALKDGLDRPKEDFIEIIKSDGEAFSRVYDYAVNTGYEGDLESFNSLLFSGKNQPISQSGLMPVNEKVSIREVQGDDGKLKIKGQNIESPSDDTKLKVRPPVDPPKYLTTADEVINLIYGSEGFKKRLENELIESKKIDDSEIDKAYYTGDKYTADDLIKIKKQRISTTPVTEVFNDDEYSNDDEYEGGFMRRSLPEEFQGMKEWGSREEFQKAYDEFWAKKHPINTEIQINPDNFKKAPLKTNDYPSEDYRSDLMAVSVEEKEHSSHVPLTTAGGGDREYNSLITPYIAKLADDNIVINSDYLKDPTEVVAKKRASEVNLMGRGLLKAGEEVTEEHFKELLNSDDLPFNVTQLLMGVSGVDYDDRGAKETLKKVQKEILDNPELYKESLSRWLNLMNKIATIQKEDGSFMV